MGDEGDDGLEPGTPVAGAGYNRVQQGFTGGVELGKPSFQTLLQQRIWRQLEGWLAFTEERRHKLEALHCKVQQVQCRLQGLIGISKDT